MSPIATNAYLSDEAYDALLDHLEQALTNASLDLRTALIEVLGDAGVWPLRCLEDRLQERAQRRHNAN